MKVAFLILTHRYSDNLIPLLESLIQYDADIFIHVDAKPSPKNLKKIIEELSEKDFEGKVKVLPVSYNIKWGGFRMVKAMLGLMRFAKEQSHYDYYATLSSDHYALLNNTEFKSYLEKLDGKSAIEFKKYEPRKGINRLNKYYFVDWTLKRFSYYHFINIPFRFLTRILPKRKVDFVPYISRQWFILNSQFVEYLLNQYSQKTTLVKRFKYTFIPDEMFFSTILLNKKEIKSETENIRTTWANYSLAHPTFVTKDDIDKAIASNALFIRKVDGSEDLISYIKKKNMAKKAL